MQLIKSKPSLLLSTPASTIYRKEVKGLRGIIIIPVCVSPCEIKNSSKRLSISLFNVTLSRGKTSGFFQPWPNPLTQHRLRQTLGAFKRKELTPDLAQSTAAVPAFLDDTFEYRLNKTGYDGKQDTTVFLCCFSVGDGLTKKKKIGKNETVQVLKRSVICDAMW